uniref:Bulb-type lectin domain-containing protein n=1 Tax=Fagus sylvatica TaxID=28930 RepID=A0A2N9FI78_FAGSY
MGVLSSMFLIPNLLFFFFETTYGVDSITPSQSLTDGNTLVSKEGNFELGFFSPGSSKNRYLGIWYKNIPVKTVVWVANRDSPIDNSSGILMINSTGTLVLLSQNKSVVWSTSSLKQAQTPLLQLLDTGNLVLTDEKNGNSEDYLWQSFDYPADTLLPREAYFFQGTVKYYRTGPWNGIGYSGLPGIKPNPMFNFTFVYNQDEVYFMFTLKDKSLLARAAYKPNHLYVSRFHTDGNSTKLEVILAQPTDRCDSYGVCGAYGICIVTELPGWENGHKKNIAAIVACSIVVVSGMLLGSYYVCSKENLRGIMERIRTIVHSSNSKGPEEDMELPLFDLSTIARATDDFSLNNKLGEGGFGPVYKAWRLWIEDRPIELIDDSVGDFNIFEVLRCIHVGLLCVQNRQEDRPNMSYVVLMLSSESLLPKPRQPGFYTDSSREADSSLSTTCSENKITFTSFEAR